MNKIFGSKKEFLLSLVCGVLLVLDVFIPDPVPFVDEILLAIGTFKPFMSAYVLNYSRRTINNAAGVAKDKLSNETNVQVKELGNKIIDKSEKILQEKSTNLISKYSNTSQKSKDCTQQTKTTTSQNTKDMKLF